jgi:predicted dehydrogenase
MPEARVAWIVDADLSRSRSLARAFEVDCHPLPDRLEALPDADVVLLAIPFGVREPYYEALRERDVAVYVEKPVCLNREQHRRLCSWFPDHRLAHGMQRRSFGPTRVVRDVLREGLFGEPIAIRHRAGRRGKLAHHGFHSDARLSGGGILAEHGVHGLDTVLYFTGATAAQVERVEMVRSHGLDIHTEARMILKSESKRPIDYTMELSWLRDAKPGLQVVFENAVLEFSIFDMTGTLHVHAKGGSWRLATNQEKPYPVTAFQIFNEHWSRFLEGLASGKANYTSVRHAELTTEVLERCYELGAGESRSS